MSDKCPTRVGRLSDKHIDKTVGIQQFKNDRSLSDAEIDTILRWVDAGAPKGDPRDMPPAKQWPAGNTWNHATLFGQTEPDLIIRSTPWTHKAGANDAWWTAGRRRADHRAEMGPRHRDRPGTNKRQNVCRTKVWRRLAFFVRPNGPAGPP